MSKIVRSKSGIRGRDRKGIRARDFDAQVASPESFPGVPLEHDMPRVMIETMRIDEGTDRLTAKDWAFYHLMLANARDKGVDKDWHEVGLRTVTGFLGDEHKEGRVRQSLKRITRALVSYDFRSEKGRAYGDVPLVIADIREDLLSGTACVRYSIPEPVREAILDAGAYAMLQLRLFPLFKSRYTAQLYQRLAWLATPPHVGNRRTWEVSPVELARILSYPIGDDGSLHVGSFLKRAVEPALADLQSEDVAWEMDFKVFMKDPVRGTGRGRPVEKLVFEVTRRTRPQETQQAARLSTVDLVAVRQHDGTHESRELPGQLAVGRAMTDTGLDGSTLARGWRAALDKAKAEPDQEVVPGLQGGTLLYVLERESVTAAFAMWSSAAAKADQVPTERRPAPAFIADESEAAASEVKALSMDKKRSFAIQGAQAMIRAIAGTIPGVTMKIRPQPTAVLAWCDEGVWPWHILADMEEPCWPDVRQALKALARADDEARRTWLPELGHSLSHWNLDELRDRANEVVRAARAGKLAEGRSVRPLKAKAFTPTRQITEASAEYDFLDPAYAAGETPWDDRCVADLETDDIPF